jgi:glycerate kinase
VHCWCWADLVGRPRALERADRVVTGEGAFDEGSFTGKVVGGVIGDARGLGLDTLVVAGRSTTTATARATGTGCGVVSLTERFGATRALEDTLACVEEATAEWLGRVGTPRGTPR